MAENFYTILTDIGLASIANAQVTQSKVDFAFIAVGDGNVLANSITKRGVARSD